MVQKAQIENTDKMIFVYYLQLQDRINEAIAVFKTVRKPEEGETSLIQYDYLLAYFDFFIGASKGYKTARRIVQKYDNYPVASWKMMFL